MTHDKENERNEKWLKSILEGLDASNSAAEATAQKLYEQAWNGGVAQRLYTSEINFSISCFWDGGFDVKLGDDMNGFDAETQVPTYADALVWLDQTARALYPDSLYATGKYPAGWREDADVSAVGDKAQETGSHEQAGTQ
jgi:squalene cyclase